MQMGIALSNFMEMPHEELFQKIREMEESELFKRLASPGREKVIDIMPVRRYFPANPAQKEGKPGDARSRPEPDAIDIESLLEKHLESAEEDMLNRIRALGVESFCYYFLNGEGTDLEAAQLLDTSPERIMSLRQAFDSVMIADSLGIQDSGRLLNRDLQRTEIIAEVSFVGDDPQISFAYERLRYRIDDDRLRALLETGGLSPEEMKQLRSLKNSILMINHRFNILHEIIERAVRLQVSYLLTLKPDDRRVLEERAMASELGFDPSWVCRLVKGKSALRLIQIRNHLIPLRDLFVSGRELKRSKGINLIRSICGEQRGGKRLTDEELRKILKQRFNISASRRAVNNWRREAETAES